MPRKLRSSSRGAISFFIASGAVGLSNFVFHAVISRSLGPSNYSVFGALLNLTLILGVPISALQVAVAARVSKFDEANKEFSIRELLVKTLVLGVVFTAALVALVPVIDRYLHIEDASYAYVTLLWLVPSVLGAVLQGVLVGQRRFGWVAGGTFFGTVVVRLAIGVILVHVGFGLDGALAASVLGQLLMAVILSLPFAARLRSSSALGGEILKVPVLDGALSVGALAGYWAMASVDSFLARHFLSSHDAGIYAAASTASRIALFAPGAISLIVLPRITAGNGDSPSARNAIRLGLFGVSIVGFGVSVVIFIFPSLVLGTLFGQQFLTGVVALRLLSFEGSILGVVGLFSYIFIARRSIVALLPWVAIPLNLLFQLLFKPSLVTLSLGVLIVSAVILGAFLFVLAHQLLAKPVTVSPEMASLASDRVAGEASHDIDLTVVIPFYNPGPSLVSHVVNLVDILRGAELLFEIVAVSDGSTDGSSLQLRELAIPEVTVYEFARNCGKGDALRAGLSVGVGSYLGFIDADGDLPAELVLNFVEVIRTSNADFVVGNKRHKDSQVVYPFARRIYSWGYQQFIRILFNVSVKDTQTGIKFTRREVVDAVLPLMVEKRFAFDLEMFVVAKMLGFDTIVDMPVVIRDRISSTISLKAVKGMLLDTLGIFYRLHIAKYYLHRRDQLFGQSLTNINPVITEA